MISLQREHLKKIGAQFQERYVYRWSASILLLLLVDVATYKAFSQSMGTQLFANQDKVLHFLAFAVLTVCGHLSLFYDFFPNTRRPLLLTIANALIWLGYGIFIEQVQKYLSYRSASFSDLLADVFGILAGLAFVRAINLYPRSPEPDGERN